MTSCRIEPATARAERCAQREFAAPLQTPGDQQRHHVHTGDNEHVATTVIRRREARHAFADKSRARRLQTRRSLVVYNAYRSSDKVEAIAAPFGLCARRG